MLVCCSLMQALCACITWQMPSQLLFTNHGMAMLRQCGRSISRIDCDSQTKQFTDYVHTPACGATTIVQSKDAWGPMHSMCALDSEQYCI